MSHVLKVQFVLKILRRNSRESSTFLRQFLSAKMKYFANQYRVSERCRWIHLFWENLPNTPHLTTVKFMQVTCAFSYTFIYKNRTQQVLLSQVNEVTSSQAMELEGLKRGIAFLEKKGVPVQSLTTDRHPSVKSFMKKEKKDIKHYFDIWHVAKGIYKHYKTENMERYCHSYFHIYM